MCDKDYTAKSSSPSNQMAMDMNRESHIIYELKQKREYLIIQLVEIQKAIEAVNRLD